MKIMIKELGEIITGSTPSKKTEEFWNSDDICFVKPDIIPDNGVNIISESNEYISEDARKKARVVTKDAIFVTCIGSIGKIGIASDREFAFNQQINAIVTNKKVNSKYLAYNLLFNKPRLVAIANAPVVPIINKSQFGEFPVKIESDVNKQSEIVGGLERLSHIIERRTKELSALDTLIKARFVEMFGEGLVDDGRFPLLPISDIGRVVSGATPKTGNADYWEGNNIWITPAELAEKSFVIYDSIRKITDEGVRSCAVNLLPIGTVILSSRAPIGKVAIVGTPMYCNQGFKNIIPNKKINSTYLYELLSMQTGYLNSLGRGATFKEISKQIVENIKVKVPPMELQNEFADFVNQVDKSKFIDIINLLKILLFFKRGMYYGN